MTPESKTKNSKPIDESIRFYIIQAKNTLYRLSIAVDDEGEKINYPEYLKDEIQAAMANLDLIIDHPTEAPRTCPSEGDSKNV